MSDFQYKPYPHQLDFHASPRRFRTLYGGRRGGKSLAGMVETIYWLYGKRDIKKPTGTLIAPTYLDLMDIHVPLLFKLIHPDNIQDWNKSEKRLTLTNGAMVTLRSADNPETLGRGRDYDFLWWDEACFSHGGSMAWQSIYPSLLDRGGKAWITTTPKGRDWVYKTFIQPAIDGDPQFAYWSFKSSDNTELDRDFLEAAKRDMSDKMYRQEILGEVVSFSGLIYPDYNESVHLEDTHEAGRDDPFFIGMDYGYQNPTAILLVAQDDKQRLHVVDEIYESKLLPVDIAKRIDEMLSRNGLTRERIIDWVWDPSIEEEDKARIHELELPFIDGTNDVLSGIAEVTRRLRYDTKRKPSLRIAKRCQHLRDEFGSYSWRTSPADSSTMDERPEKAYDHALDSLRYICMAYPEAATPVVRDPWTDEVIDDGIGIEMEEERVLEVD